jgi:hypothetical protein
MGNSVARDFWNEILDLRAAVTDDRRKQRRKPPKTKARLVRTFPAAHRPR